jgi:hypothetical protein
MDSYTIYVAFVSVLFSRQLYEFDNTVPKGNVRVLIYKCSVEDRNATLRDYMLCRDWKYPKEIYHILTVHRNVKFTN